MDNPKITSQGKPSLTQYFQAVDRRLERLFPVKNSYRVKVAGRLIEICLPAVEPLDIQDRSLSGFLTQETGPVDATFYYWNDDCQPYLPAGADRSSAVWQSRDETGFLQVSTDNGMIIGSDLLRSRFYFCWPFAHQEDYNFCGKMMAPIFSRWARARDLFLLHSAAVGVDGSGVLIAGRSGSGKSTLSLSCLHCGMDFVSDDYTLISASGPLMAYPLFTQGALNPDMLERLNPANARTIVPKHICDGKPQLDLSQYALCPQLKIKAVVAPIVGGDPIPSIKKTKRTFPMAQIIHSSILQFGSTHDTQLPRTMAARLMSLPVYEMRVSPDLMKNPDLLYRFIKEEL